MRPSEPSQRHAPAFDWRGWVILAWVLWFGLLYARMVVEQRAHRFRELIAVPTPK